MKLFGINEFAARLPNALCGTATLLVIFNIGTKLKNAHFGLLWAIKHYSSMTYVPLSFLAVAYQYKREEKHWANSKIINVALLIWGVIIALLLIGMPTLFNYKAKWAHLIKDDFCSCIA